MLPSEREGLCQVTIDALQDPVHVVDRDLRIVLTNLTHRRWCRRLGLKSPRLGRTVYEIAPFLPEQVRREYRQVFRTGRVLVTQEVNTVAGRQIATETQKIPLFAGGKVTRVVTVMRDITARKRAETALRDSEERLRAILSSLHETIIAVYGLDGRLLSAWSAPELQRRYGVSLQQLLGKSIREFWPPPVAERRMRHIRMIFRSGGTVREEYTVRMPRGDFRFESMLSPMRDACGKVAAVVCFTRDITEHKKAEAAVRESEEKYRFLLENAADVVYAMSADGVVTYVSPQVARYGLRPEQLVGRNVLELIVPEDRDGVARDLDRAVRTGEEFPTDFRMRDADGGVHWFEDRGRARRDARGKVVGLSGFLRDITDRKLAEQALREAHAKLVNAREEERRHLAAELHDSLGQAMIGIHLQLENVRAQAASRDDEPLAGPLEELSNQCNELIREVRQISYGLFPATLEELGLPAALRHLLSICRLASIEARLRCGRGVEGAHFGGLVEIALFRVAQEAVNNAIRHSECRRVNVTLRYAKGRLVLRVADDGKGFDSSAPGRGMGLGSMRERAEAIGAELRVTSRPGQTCVELGVPTEKR